MKKFTLLFFLLICFGFFSSCDDDNYEYLEYQLVDTGDFLSVEDFGNGRGIAVFPPFAGPGFPRSFDVDIEYVQGDLRNIYFYDQSSSFTDFEGIGTFDRDRCNISVFWSEGFDNFRVIFNGER